MGAQKVPKKIEDEGTTYLSELTMVSVASIPTQRIQPKQNLHQSVSTDADNNIGTNEASCQITQGPIVPNSTRCVSVDLPLLTLPLRECYEREKYTGNNWDMMASSQKLDTTRGSPNTFFRKMHESTAPLPYCENESEMDSGLWNENDLVDIWKDTGLEEPKESLDDVVSIRQNDNWEMVTGYWCYNYTYFLLSNICWVQSNQKQRHLWYTITIS